MKYTMKEYTLDNLYGAPTEPGIYAWYLNTELRTADLNDNHATKTNLFRIFNQLKLPNFDIEARGNLSLHLKGTLAHSTVGSEDGPEFSSLVENILQNEDSRKLFATILKQSTPHLMSPLYIGVTNNIRRRLKDHKNDIDNFRKIIKTRVYDAQAEEPKQKFALEIVKRGIPNRYLHVFVSTNFDYKGSLEEERKAAEAVETILNRLFYPIFGRR